MSTESKMDASLGRTEESLNRIDSTLADIRRLLDEPLVPTTDPLTGTEGYVPEGWIHSEPMNQHGRTVPQGRITPPKETK